MVGCHQETKNKTMKIKGFAYIIQEEGFNFQISEKLSELIRNQMNHVLENYTFEEETHPNLSIYQVWHSDLEEMIFRKPVKVENSDNTEHFFWFATQDYKTTNHQIELYVNQLFELFSKAFETYYKIAPNEVLEARNFVLEELNQNPSEYEFQEQEFTVEELEMLANLKL